MRAEARAPNVLAAAGVTTAENSTVFSGHLPGDRGALGVREIGPRTLLLIHKAPMMSMPDLADIIAHAARQGAKAIIAGDQEQLAPVESAAE
jgi:ATP-dependent exoDNAse (exonuclease V) alpha subunit